MSANEAIVSVFEKNKQQPVAEIALNGYNIAAGGVFGLSGAMRSFRVVKGDIVPYWQTQTALTIRDEHGEERKIRVFAVPVEADSSGLVEFL